MTKRLLDVLGAIVALIATSPLLGIAALTVRLKMGSPVLFRQARLGYHEQPFTLVKLRTMTGERDATGALLPDADRLTSLGRLLRATSVDELPELWNVLRSDMSLVGPRPLPVEYLRRYTSDERRRHEVKPGVTGWAQVQGRNAVGWDERLAMDAWYVDHRSLWLDLRILACTPAAVIRRLGINADGEATMAALRPHLADEADS